MIQQQRQRIDQAVSEMVNDMDKSCLRKMQIDMHKCATKCCEDMTSNMDTVQRCVERCSKPLTTAQNYVQQELNEFHGRLQRCIMQCNDDITIKMPPNPSEENVAKYTDQFERCAIKCVDKYVGVLPTMVESMKTVLTKGSNSTSNI